MVRMLVVLGVFCLAFIWFLGERTPKSSLPPNPNVGVSFTESNLRDLYLAGGCFWGVEAYMARIPGVAEATVGYANGNGKNPTYEDVLKGDRGFVETVHIRYDETKVTLPDLLTAYFKVINPTMLNQQGNDRGVQYRTGIYYTNFAERETIEQFVKAQQPRYKKPIVTEVLPLDNFYLAEEYHQDYLEKNPNGYCHIDMGKLKD